MKLLICTQVVDKNHPILGFFHRWIEEFAKQCEVVHVICLYEGEHSLPTNVRVHSLGKEGGESRIKYLTRFYSYIWKLRNEYDTVFVHMNQIYVILGAPVWRSLGKKIGLWYAHGKVSNSLRLAEKLSHIMFTSTEEGLQLSTHKKRIVGQGIDLDHFTYKQRTALHTPLRLITVGRISQSKNIGTLIDACTLLKNENIAFIFQIVGTAITEEEKEYEKRMRERVSEHNLGRDIIWVGPVSQNELLPLLHEADIFIHDGATQSLDKALLEAVACGCVVISSNPSYASLTRAYVPQYIYESLDSKHLVSIIENIKKDDFYNVKLTKEVVYKELSEHHSLRKFTERIIHEISI